jgi:hypothetical protein
VSLAAAAVFYLVAFVLLFLSLPIIPDGDSYFHLAIGRLYADQGIVTELESARFSVMADGYGDKEFLFHLLLAPLASPTGGRIALALLNAGIATLLTWLGMRAGGMWGLLAPLIVYVGAGSFIGRVFRLRPELLSLLILLAAIYAAARRRYVILALLSAIFALSYTAFHALLGLALIWFFYEGIVRRLWDWKLLAAVFGGVAVGLLVHPGFPSNLQVWAIQNIAFFREGQQLDIGGEILAASTRDVLMFNLGWWLSMFALLLASQRRAEASPAGRESTFFALAAAAFAVLFLLMDRMAIYFFPFATLALLFGIGKRLGHTGASIDAGRFRVPTALAILFALMASLPAQRFIFQTLRTRGAAEADYIQLAQHLPAGARVAAEWGAAGHYLFWSPGSRFLNFLDPIFMARPHPERYALQRSLFAGAEPDSPLVSLAGLDSEYLAFERASSPTLERRLRRDPRITILHSGENLLARIDRESNQRFVLDWDVFGPGGGERTRYPRIAGFADVEGFVDATRVVPREERCAHFTAERQRITGSELELAAYGPTVVTVDGTTRFATQSGGGAVPGEGIRFVLEPEARRIDVQTCRPAPGRRAGFYLIDRTALQLIGAAKQ